MRVAVSAPGSTALFETRLSANGSASSFAPMPAGLFANSGDTSAGVRTQFASLTFDPYLNVTTSGVTRLAFTSAAAGNAPLEVSGLTTPIYFNMSAVTIATAGEKAQCQFWDIAASPPAYLTAGCSGLPNPLPASADAQVFWTPGFSTLTDAGMASAWDVTVAPRRRRTCSGTLPALVALRFTTFTRACIRLAASTRLHMSLARWLCRSKTTHGRVASWKR
jgi:hypothetical protein